MGKVDVSAYVGWEEVVPGRDIQLYVFRNHSGGGRSVQTVPSSKGWEQS
jgi:hypothetical protein